MTDIAARKSYDDGESNVDQPRRGAPGGEESVRCCGRPKLGLELSPLGEHLEQDSESGFVLVSGSLQVIYRRRLSTELTVQHHEIHGAGEPVVLIRPGFGDSRIPVFTDRFRMCGVRPVRACPA